MTNNDIIKLMNLDVDTCFVINKKWLCKFYGFTFNDWKKDVNSPSQVKDAYIHIFEDNKSFDGCISIHRDPSLSNEFYAFLYLKNPMDEKWTQMFNVNDISFK